MSVRSAHFIGKILALAGCMSLLVASVAFAADVNLALGKSYTVEAHAPDEGLANNEKAYPDTDGKEMTDGLRGKGQDFKESEWVGHLRQEGFTVVIDLGAVANVNRVVANFLAYPGAGIYLPEEMEVSFSTDGNSWTTAQSVTVEAPEGNGVVAFTLDKAQAGARYVRVVVPTNVWVFVDEIEVWGTK